MNVDIETENLKETKKIMKNSSISFLRVQRDFNGYFIGLVTNNTLLLNAIIQTKLEVVPPWIATTLSPQEFLFPQGKEEFYWNTFWLRFYESIDGKDLTQYLSQYEIPIVWKDYFEI